MIRQDVKRSRFLNCSSVLKKKYIIVIKILVSPVELFFLNNPVFLILLKIVNPEYSKCKFGHAIFSVTLFDSLFVNDFLTVHNHFCQ